MLAGAVADGGRPPRLMRSAGRRDSSGCMGAGSEEDPDSACARMRKEAVQPGVDACSDGLGQRTIPALMAQRRKVRNSHQSNSGINDSTDQLRKASSPSSAEELEALRPAAQGKFYALILSFFFPLGPKPLIILFSISVPGCFQDEPSTEGHSNQPNGIYFPRACCGLSEFFLSESTF
jgi:hypothetical protein